MSIEVEVPGEGDLNGYVYQRQRTVTGRIRAVHGGLNGGELRLIGKLPQHLQDEGDSNAIINLHSGASGGITLDSSNTNVIMVGRFELSPTKTPQLQLLEPGTEIQLAVQVGNSDGEVILSEWRGNMTVAGDLVKTAPPAGTP